MLSFNDCLGQSDVIDHLRKASSLGAPSHAYIICGDPGSGKKMIAERFAAALMCTGEGEKPCGSCISCMQAESHNHPDIIYVTHEKTRITVDDIRQQVIGDIQIKPYSGNYKVYIIDEADKMNEAAQNAILKTLEEPPEYSVILLLAKGTGSFLQTILSRCVVLRLKPVEPGIIRDLLVKEHGIPDYLANLCAAFSCGSVGTAVKYATDGSFSEIKDDVLHIVKHIDDMKQSEIADMLSSFDSDKEKKASIGEFFDLMRMWYRDVLVYKATGTAGKVLFTPEITDIRREAQLRSYENLNSIQTAIDEAEARIAANVNFVTAVELLFITMKNH